MKQWKSVLPHFWLVLGLDEGLPELCQQGLHAPPPALPERQIADSSPFPLGEHAMTKLTAKISLSIGTANVSSMYRGEWGHAGKVHFLRQQFLHFRFNWLGLQETRTPEGFSRSEGVFRFCSGANRDQHGVEFWVNGSAPYGYVGNEPLLFQPGHFQVLARHARHLLIRVAAPFLDCLVLVGYAPHSGLAPSEPQE